MLDYSVEGGVWLEVMKFVVVPHNPSRAGVLFPHTLERNHNKKSQIFSTKTQVKNIARWFNGVVVTLNLAKV